MTTFEDRKANQQTNWSVFQERFRTQPSVDIHRSATSLTPPLGKLNNTDYYLCSRKLVTEPWPPTSPSMPVGTKNPVHQFRSHRKANLAQEKNLATIERYCFRTPSTPKSAQEFKVAEFNVQISLRLRIHRLIH